VDTRKKCPYCSQELGFGSTTSKFYLTCDTCQIRFNDNGKPMLITLTDTVRIVELLTMALFDIKNPKKIFPPIYGDDTTQEGLDKMINLYDALRGV